MEQGKTNTDRGMTDVSTSCNTWKEGKLKFLWGKEVCEPKKVVAPSDKLQRERGENGG